MNTVAVLNRKGGVGKTTIATNLARAYQLKGLETVLIDTDEQGTARDWAHTGEDMPVTLGVDRPNIHEQLPKLHGYSAAVIDGVAKMEEMSVSAVKAADLVLIPIQPSAADFWTAGELIDLIETQQRLTEGLEAAFVISRAITGTNLAGSASEALSRLSFPVLKARTHQRVAYPQALGKGISVIDLDDSSKAAEEIRALAKETLTILESETKTYE
ncbi:ParA family partition ATPase [Salinibacter ruber]|uniref:Chromosome partitioning protein n=1 Tax=Salinibacter ruber TaxID=146919 RepID=A0A9X2UP51_9BACT|nr:ParA family partition ATPase [Salinibacter ruber]MCS4038309.1 chromosome partitioning protein [Salinibacter ruber]